MTTAERLERIEQLLANTPATRVCPHHEGFSKTLASIDTRIEDGNALFSKISATCAARGEQVNTLRRDVDTLMADKGEAQKVRRGWGQLLLELAVLALVAYGSAHIGAKSAASNEVMPHAKCKQRAAMPQAAKTSSESPARQGSPIKAQPK